MTSPDDGRQGADPGTRERRREDPDEQQVEGREQGAPGEILEPQAREPGRSDRERKRGERQDHERPGRGPGPPRSASPGHDRPPGERDRDDAEAREPQRELIDAQPAAAQQHGVEEQEREAHPREDGQRRCSLSGLLAHRHRRQRRTRVLVRDRRHAGRGPNLRRPGSRPQTRGMDANDGLAALREARWNGARVGLLAGDITSCDCGCHRERCQ